MGQRKRVRWKFQNLDSPGIELIKGQTQTLFREFVIFPNAHYLVQKLCLTLRITTRFNGVQCNASYNRIVRYIFDYTIDVTYQIMVPKNIMMKRCVCLKHN